MESVESGIVGKGSFVVKSNRLIEASYRLSMVEQQIILYAICKSRENQTGLSSDSPVTIIAAEFAEMFSLNEKSVYAQLKTAITSLYARSVNIRRIDVDTGKVIAIDHRWISRKAYIDGAGRVQIIFASDIIPYITRLGESGEFTSYKLKHISKMSSVHAVRLYELLIQYRAIGSRDFSISDLRSMLCLQSEYASIKDFKKHVIDLAVTQINEYTDMEISYVQQKSGRIVTNMVFNIKAKPMPLNTPLNTLSNTPSKQKVSLSVNNDFVLKAGNGVTVKHGFGKS